jgi:hypothetical protein
MTGIPQRRRLSLLDRPWATLLFFGAMAVGSSALFGWALDSGGKSDAEHKLCDQAVAALLHSKDLVEVQRAGIIIREIPCGVGRRLTEDQK